MDNGQKIIDKILSDAKAEAAKIEDAARIEADKTISDAKAKAEREKQKAVEAAKEEAAKAAAKEISSAQMKANQMILTAKQKCIEDAVEKAEKKLSGMSPEEYRDTVMKMLSAWNPENGNEIIFSAEDKKSLSEDIKKLGYTVSEETRDINGGFIIKKGDIEYNYSFESIIAVEKEQIDQVAAQILFAGR